MEPVNAVMIFIGAHGAELAWGSGVFLAGLAGSLGAVTYVLVHLPEDFLVNPEAAPPRTEVPRWKRTAAKVGKNIVGVGLIGAGLSMAIPGVPGPGVLTVVIGAALLDIPGQRRLQQRILGVPRVFGLVNRLRGRFGEGPLRAAPAHRDATAA
jgi:hypothetical protein